MIHLRMALVAQIESESTPWWPLVVSIVLGLASLGWCARGLFDRGFQRAILLSLAALGMAIALFVLAGFRSDLVPENLLPWLRAQPLWQLAVALILGIWALTCLLSPGQPTASKQWLIRTIAVLPLAAMLWFMGQALQPVLSSDVQQNLEPLPLLKMAAVVGSVPFAIFLFVSLIAGMKSSPQPGRARTTPAGRTDHGSEPLPEREEEISPTTPSSEAPVEFSVPLTESQQWTPAADSSATLESEESPESRSSGPKATATVKRSSPEAPFSTPETSPVHKEGSPLSTDQSDSANGANAKRWYYRTENGDEQGPISWAELCQLARQGQIQGNQLVWFPTVRQWVLASRVPNLPLVTASQASPPAPVAAKPVPQPVSHSNPQPVPQPVQQTPQPTPQPVPQPVSEPTAGRAAAPSVAPAPAAVQAPTQKKAPSRTWEKKELIVPAQHFQSGTKVLEFRKGDKLVRAPARLGERYEVEGILACGGMGAILKARDQVLGGRPVLIKMGLFDHADLFPEPHRPKNRIDREIQDQRQRLEDEREKLRDLYRDLDDRIPAVCHFLTDYSAQLHGPHGASQWYWEEEQSGSIDVPELLSQEPYLVLRYIEGTNLKDLLGADSQELGPLKSVERARVCFMLARELSGMFMQFHRRRGASDGENRKVKRYYVYQDLKPDNIIRAPIGDFYLIDFGTVKEVTIRDGYHEFDVNPDHTEGYSAPEIRDYEVSEWSDIYTLGATLYHVVTGDQPRPGDLRPFLDGARKTFPAAIYSGLLDLIACCIEPEVDARTEAVLNLAEDNKDSSRSLPVEVLRQFIIKKSKEI